MSSYSEIVFSLSQTFPVLMEGGEKSLGGLIPWFSYFPPIALHLLILYCGFSVYCTILCDGGKSYTGITFYLTS